MYLIPKRTSKMFFKLFMNSSKEKKMERKYWYIMKKLIIYIISDITLCIFYILNVAKVHNS